MSQPSSERSVEDSAATQHFWAALTAPVRTHYYRRVRGALMPAIRRRPVVTTSMETFHDRSWDQHGRTGLPDWFPTYTFHLQGRSHTRPVVTSMRGLDWFVDAGSVEFHTTQWAVPPRGSPLAAATRNGHPTPDHMVFNLDPGTHTDLHACAEIAHIITELTDTDEGAAVPVSTGRRGLHLYLPVTDRHSSDVLNQARQIARRVATIVPTLATATSSRRDRLGRVFIDTTPNRPTATTIAPYSMRAGYPFTVAAPRTWAELHEPDVAQLTLQTMLDRLATPPAHTRRHPRFWLPP